MHSAYAPALAAEAASPVRVRRPAAGRAREGFLGMGVCPVPVVDEPAPPGGPRTGLRKGRAEADILSGTRKPPERPSSRGGGGQPVKVK
ncbi:hypothetical protein GCM10010232_31910 [Streptomyces amakusaensis]